jgi:predicted nucleotidyltransferase
MNYDQLKHFFPQINTIALKHGISRVFLFGSVAREQTTTTSDIDFLVEMQEGASLFGITGFAYEVEQLLGILVDVVPASALHRVKDQKFVDNIRKDAIAI